jgi:hypothetical protein
MTISAGPAAERYPPTIQPQQRGAILLQHAHIALRNVLAHREPRRGRSQRIGERSGSMCASSLQPLLERSALPNRVTV